MSHVIALLSLIVRLFRPSRGIHAVPRALRRDVREEARAARPRRYVPEIPPAAPTGPGYGNPFASLVPVVEPDAVQPPAALVRPGYRAWEAARTARKAVAA